MSSRGGPRLGSPPAAELAFTFANYAVSSDRAFGVLKVARGTGARPPMKFLTPRVAKVLVSVTSTFPAIDLVRVLYRHNPNFIHAYDFPSFMLAINVSGRWAFVFLFLALACTPVQRLVRSPLVPAVRRSLGLAAFGYCVLHFLAYFVVGQKLSVEYTIKDAIAQSSRPPGWLSLVLLIPLALTSTDGMARRLGGKRWKRLHRLVYLSAAAAIYHTYLVEAARHGNYNTTRNTLIVFVVLMLARLIRVKRAAEPAPRGEGHGSP